MMKVIRAMSFRLVPGNCLLCAQFTGRDQDLCEPCEQDLPRVRYPCRRCGVPLPAQRGLCLACIIKPAPYAATVAPFLYVSPIDRLIVSFKSRGDRKVGRALAESMAASYQAVTDESQYPDLLVPVPLHRRRLRERGYNQALEIAAVLAESTGITVDNGICRRAIDTPPQKSLSARQRLSNLAGAFIATRDVAGAAVAVVDDVVTTGTTVSALSRVLLSHGARRVEVIALARTPPP